MFSKKVFRSIPILTGILLLCAMIGAGTCPVSALSEEEVPVLSLGTEQLVPGSRVWFGGADAPKNIKWLVLARDEPGKAVLIPDGISLGISDFHSEENFQWKDSLAQQWCRSYYERWLDGMEKSAILPTTKEEKNDQTDEDITYSYQGGKYDFYYRAAPLENEFFFLLSAEEADTWFHSDDERFAGYAEQEWPYWWLRSPDAEDPDNAASVDMNGTLGHSLYTNDFGMRPAFSLNLDAILLVSAARSKSNSTDGIPSVPGAAALSAIPSGHTAEWKLTLRDDSRSFHPTVTEATESPDGTFLIPYENAIPGENEYISVLLCGPDGAAMYYGSVSVGSASGEAVFALPAEGLTQGEYLLKVFNVQQNGDKMSDYSSPISDVLLTVTGEGLNRSDAQENRAQEASDGIRSTAVLEWICQQCGTECYMNVCPMCGNPCPEERTTDGLLPGNARSTEQVVPCVSHTQLEDEQMAYILLRDWKSFVPLYPQPLNAYIVFNNRSDVWTSEGETTVDKAPESKRADLRDYLTQVAEKIQTLSDHAIRFVGDPDEADILISISIYYDFYANYSSGSQTAKGYSCEVYVYATQMSNPENTLSFWRKNEPSQTETLSRNAGKFWKSPPSVSGGKMTEALSDLVAEVCSWYGYCPGNASDDSVREEGIRKIQEILIRRGYLTGEADGIFDEKTMFAVRNLQLAYGLTVNGRIDYATLGILYYEPDEPDAEPEETDLQRQNDAVFAHPLLCEQCGAVYEDYVDYLYCPVCGWKSARTSIGEAVPGSIVQFGRYEQDGISANGAEAISWLVLDISDGKMLLLSQYGIDCMKYVNDQKVKSISWEKSDVRSWLNGEFLTSSFSRQEQSAILTTHVDNQPDGGKNTKDKVFLLSREEAFETYFDSDEDRRCELTDYARQSGARTSKIGMGEFGSWLLRSPDHNTSSGHVYADGSYGTEYAFWSGRCIRPAIWIDLTSALSASDDPSGQENLQPAETGENQMMNGQTAITVQGVELKKESRDGSGTVVKLRKGREVIILEEEGDWYRVSVDLGGSKVAEGYLKKSEVKVD